MTPRYSNRGRIRFSFTLVLTFATFLTVGCGEEPGRVRATREQVVGIYETKLIDGQEVLDLKADQTYIQYINSGPKPSFHFGKWRIEDHFFGGSDVIVMDCVVSEDEKGTAPERIGERRLEVHCKAGELTLAINEVADWYFTRIK